MNKIILGIFVGLIAVIVFAVPVMAAPITKIEGVTAILDYTSTVVYNVVDHGILQVREGVATGTVTINIPGQAPLIGTLYGEFIGTMKLDGPPPGPWLNGESMMVGHEIWTFTGEGTTGTFEGVRHEEIIGWPQPFISYFESSMLLYGTGDFQGQTLKLSFEGAPPPIFEGCLLIPN